MEAEADTRVDGESSELESESESEAEDASRQAKALACEKRDEKDEWGEVKEARGEGDDIYARE
jgi:hypothetical protein